jgi:predicted RNA-binding protein with PUA-like domain
VAYWLFQGNPKYYRVIDAIRDFEQMPWLVTRYAKEIAVGDGVLIWLAGKDSGIYAIAEVIEPAKMLSEVPDIAYWIEKSRLASKPQACIRFTSKLIEKPIFRASLKQDPLLQNLLVIRAPNSTNYKVTPQEWKRVHELNG